VRSDHVLHLAMARYAGAIRAGTATPYECLRFFENRCSYRDADGDELQRLAVLALVRHDPLLLITAPQGGRIDGLSESDVDAVVAGWNVDDEALAALLEAHLRMATAAHHDSRREGMARALAALERAAPRFRGDVEFLELYTKALRRSGDPRFPAVVDELVERTAPEWRAPPLRDAMHEAVERSDWQRYDALRLRWAALPRSALVCECATHWVANVDGVRALHRGDRQEALRCLRAAVAVQGCPHLNTGAATLRLAEALLDRGGADAEVAEHRDAVEQFCRTEAAARLRARLGGARAATILGAGADGAPAGAARGDAAAPAARELHVLLRSDAFAVDPVEARVRTRAPGADLACWLHGRLVERPGLASATAPRDDGAGGFAMRVRCGRALVVLTVCCFAPRERTWYLHAVARQRWPRWGGDHRVLAAANVRVALERVLADPCIDAVRWLDGDPWSGAGEPALPAPRGLDGDA
jgi:hypothetical protein